MGAGSCEIFELAVPDKISKKRPTASEASKVVVPLFPERTHGPGSKSAPRRPIADKGYVEVETPGQRGCHCGRPDGTVCNAPKRRDSLFCNGHARYFAVERGEPEPPPVHRSHPTVNNQLGPVEPGEKTVIRFQLRGKYAQLYNHPELVGEMDDEELSRMQFRGDNGKFNGRGPNNLPKTMVQGMRKELLARATAIFDGSLLISIKTLAEIAASSYASDKDRIKASNLLIERVMGKTPSKVEVSGEMKPFEILLGRISKRRELELGAHPTHGNDEGDEDDLER